MTNTDTALRFHLTQNRWGIYFTPANDAAKVTLPKGRKCLHSFELCEVIKSGKPVELNLNPFLAVQYWVAVTPTTLPAA